MNSELLLQHVNELIDRVNGIKKISARGLKNKPFPDEMIASLHSHLGNAKHFISDELMAFNAIEQFLSLKSAIRELDEAGNDIFALHQHNLLKDLEYQMLNRHIHELSEFLRKDIDSDYF